MKCIPITLSALEVFAAILVIDMEEVLVDKIHSLGLCKSISLNIESFISKFSVAASITNSAFSTPLLISEIVVKLFKVFFFCSSVIFSLATILSKFLEIVLTAFSNAS